MSSDALHALVWVKFLCCESRLVGFLCATLRSRGREALRRLWENMVVPVVPVGRSSHAELNMDHDYYSVDAILAENQVEYSCHKLGDSVRY